MKIVTSSSFDFRKWHQWVALCFFICGFPVAVFAQETQPSINIKIATTFWPPYMDPDLPNNGIISEVVHSTFRRAGVEAGVVFAPWQRSQTAMLSSDKYDASFPVYATRQRLTECHLSGVIGASPIGFAQRKDKPITWNKLEDLKGTHIGTVIGYSNTDSFDQLVAEGTIEVSTVPLDLINLRRLIFARIDLAVMDKYVFRYLLKNSPELTRSGKALGFNSKIMKRQNLYVCFPKHEAGRKLRDSFNAALDPSDINRVIENGLSSLRLDDKKWSQSQPSK